MLSISIQLERPDQNKSSTIDSCFSVFHRDMVHARSIAESTKVAYEIIMLKGERPV